MQPHELVLIARYFGQAGGTQMALRAVTCAMPKVAEAARAAAAKQLSDSQLIDHFFRDHDKKKGESDGH